MAVIGRSCKLVYMKRARLIVMLVYFDLVEYIYIYIYIYILYCCIADFAYHIVLVNSYQIIYMLSSVC